MANHVGIELSRLIRDRAYAAGVVAARSAHLERAKVILARAVAQLDEAQALVTQLDTCIEEVYELDPGEIRSIRALPKTGLFQYGELTRELVRILRESAPQAITTTMIIAAVSQALSLPTETAMQRAVTRRRVVKQLQKYARTSGKPGANGESRKRPETNRFMPTVAMIHLNFTTEQKRTTPLAIEGYADGTFHTICNWVGAYHPDYHSRRIYLGRCKVKALDKAMIVKFWGKISLTGDRNKRTVPAEISLSKTRLNNENADLLSDLQSLSDSSGEAWCYFFSDAKPTVAEFPPKNGWQGKTVARFSVASLDHIAVIPVSELTAPELAEHEP